MNRQFNIEIIEKVIKPKSGNSFINILLNVFTIILYPIIILVGLTFILFVVLISFFQRLTSKKEEKQVENSSDLKNISFDNQWAILAETNKLKIYQQYAGEIRFGAVYLKLKSNPQIASLNNKIFGDWFFRYKNGIFLQQWNSFDSANANLIFVDTEKFDLKIIRKNIPSVIWKINVTENKILELICDTGKEILTYKIETTEY